MCLVMVLTMSYVTHYTNIMPFDVSKLIRYDTLEELNEALSKNDKTEELVRAFMQCLVLGSFFFIRLLVLD